MSKPSLAVLTAPRRRQFLRTATRLVAVPVLVATMLSAPVGGPSGSPWPPTALAAATCTGWTSDSLPPTTIRVLRTAGPASGSVQVVPFHDYVTVVMAAEWGSSSPAEALKAGAVAVKEYAWYHAMFWRGKSAADGSCYDVVDSSMDQIYAPELRVPAASLTAAVEATWGISVRKKTGLFVTHYDGGSNVACGANADGWHLYQVSAMHCARDGMTAEAILETYYGPGLEIVGAPSSPASAIALSFLAQPLGGTAGIPFPVQPVVAVVGAAGQTVTAGTSSGATVSLTLASATPDAVLTCTNGLSRTAVAGLATFDGCQLSAAAPGAVLVASAAGLAPASAAPFTVAPFAVAPAAPALTLEPSGTFVTWGQDVQLTAGFAPPGLEGAGGRAVHLQGSIDGIGWILVADLVTDANGTASVVQRPAANTYYRLAFDGAPDLAPATSPVFRVLVRNVVQLRPDNRGAVRRVSRGTTVTFSTLVRPLPTSVTPGRVEYRLLQLVGRAWVLKRSWTVTPDAAGTARLRLTLGSRGSWSVRVVALSSPTNAISALSPGQRYDVP